MDQNGDGIGDTQYMIDESNQDRYPLIHSWSPTGSPKLPIEDEIPFWTQWWFWAIVTVGIVGLAGAVYFQKKKKPPTPTGSINVVANVDLQK